jgi:hypothetical protein
MKNAVEKEKKSKGTEGGKKLLNRLMERRNAKNWRWIGRDSKKRENSTNKEQTLEQENEEDQKWK